MSYLKFFFAGDVVVNRNTDVTFLDYELQKIMDDCSVKCCNFEAPVRFEGQSPINKIGPVISQSYEGALRVLEAGFNLFNLANNHIMDYGSEGLKKTREILKDCYFIGAGFAKEEVYRPFIYSDGDIKIAIMSVAEKGFGFFEEEQSEGYAWMCAPEIEKCIKELKLECDIIIMNCHAGAEELIVPLPEIKDMYRYFVSLGVNIIIGHHPHVVQGYERYNDAWIFYSLGNFAFDSLEDECVAENPESYGLIIEVRNKQITTQIIPTIYTEGQVRLYNNEKWIQEIENRNQLLFKEDDYWNTINQYCINIYEQEYKSYYMSASGGLYLNTLKDKLRSIYKILFNKAIFSDKWLWHNIGIETHRWVVIRALQLTMNKQEEE